MAAAPTLSNTCVRSLRWQRRGWCLVTVSKSKSQTQIILKGGGWFKGGAVGEAVLGGGVPQRVNTVRRSLEPRRRIERLPPP